MNVLKGEKLDGVWKFTEEEFAEFIQSPYVKPSLQAKNKAIVFDFLAQNEKRINEICTVKAKKAMINSYKNIISKTQYSFLPNLVENSYTEEEFFNIALVICLYGIVAILLLNTAFIAFFCSSVNFSKIFHSPFGITLITCQFFYMVALTVLPRISVCRFL